MLAHLPQGQKIIEQAYDTVEKVMKEVADYVGEWLRYQVLFFRAKRYRNPFFLNRFFSPSNRILFFHALSIFRRFGTCNPMFYMKDLEVTYRNG